MIDSSDPVELNTGAAEIAWQPTPEYLARSRLRRFMERYGIPTFPQLYRRSVTDMEWYWDAVVQDLELEFFTPYSRVLDLPAGIEWPRWFVGGAYNYVHDAVDRQAASRPNGTAISWEGEDGEVRTLTYGELHTQVSRAANVLRSLGIGKGDRIGVFMPMLPETAVATLAISRLGAIYVPIFSGYGAAAVASRLNDCDARLLITADGFYRAGKAISMLQIATKAATLSPSLESILVVPRLQGTEYNPKSKVGVPSGPTKCVDWRALVDSQPDHCPTEQTAADDPFMVIYTSGTTGQPKGVVHVHSGFPIKAAQELAYCFDLHAGERLFYLSDIGWMMGPWSIIGSLMLGATLFLYEGAITYPQPDRIWEMVERHGITHLGISPTAVRSLMAHGDEMVKRHDLRSLQILAGAGEPWSEGAWRWLFEVVGEGKRPIINYSGGTEVSGGILSNNTLLPIKPCAFSGPVPGMAADVVDEAGNSVRGQVGELALRTPCPGTTRDFWRDPDRYLETYWSRVPGLWMHGDWARLDDDGFWYILGRSDDTIKVAGKRIGPAEVESAALSHPAVAEAAAVGVPDELKGEALILFAVLRARHSPNDTLRAEIEATVVSHLGKALKPHAVLFTEELPRTRNGKILRRLVRQSYLGEPPGDLSALENPSALKAVASAK